MVKNVVKPENNSPSGADEQAELEAATWSIRLAEEPQNTQLKAEFEHWLAKSEHNRQLFEEIQIARELLENSEPTTEHQWPQIQVEKPAQQRLKESRATQANLVTTSTGFSLSTFCGGWQFNWQKVALSTVLCCGLLFFLAPQLQLQIDADYITGTAEQTILTLEDGSRVSLAPESALSIDYQADQRRVHLLKGTAFFQVTPNAARSFTVVSGDTQTTVLGTAFNVRRTVNGTSVSVEAGRVQVDDAGMVPAVSEQLQAGDQLQVTWQKNAVLSRINPDDVALWRKGKLIVRNLPMSELIDRLRGYHKGAIIVQSAQFSGLRVSGLYQLDDPLTTLNNLASAYDAEVTQISPWIVLVH